MKYKIRALFTLVILIITGFINSGVGQAARVPIENSASLATVNGGDAAFVGAAATHSFLNGTSIIFDLVFLALLVMIWFNPIKNSVQSEETK